MPRPTFAVSARAVARVMGALAVAALAAGLALAPSGWELRLDGALALAAGSGLALWLARSLARARATAQASLAEREADARERELHDPLTGLLNAPALNDYLVRAAARARRRVEPLSVLVLDVCELGEINKRLGPQAGDAVLREFATCMRDTLRAEDAYGRLDGDRFLVILTGTIGVQAEIAAERLRTVVSRTDFPGLEPGRGIELCVGSATGIRATPERLLDAAVEELRRVKALRRGSSTVRA